MIVMKILILILTFGFAVFVHEFGHMFFALIRGVGVESFAIGMGPKICAWRWKGIEFSLRWFPVGGFVKLMGPEARARREAEMASAAAQGDWAHPHEQTHPIAHSGALTVGDVTVDNAEAPSEEADKSISESSYDDLLALADKGLLTKLLVFGGGVFMNYMTAIVATAALLMMSMKEPAVAPVIYAVDAEAGSPLAAIAPGDRIVSFLGEPVTYYGDIFHVAEDEIRAAAEAQDLSVDEVTVPVTIGFDHEGQSEAIDLGPMTRAQLGETVGRLDILVPPIIGNTQPTAPADKAGFERNDVIVSAGGRPIRSYNEFREVIEANLAKPVDVVVRRGDETKSLTVTPVEHIYDKTKGMIGVEAGSESTIERKGMAPLAAIVSAPRATWNRLVSLVRLHVDFFSHASFSQIRQNLGGPIMIANLTMHQAELGFSYSLDWFITLNILLMIFNLAPLPVLDGGFIVLSFIEAIIRRPVPPKVLAPIYTTFVVFFIGLMLVISLMDVKRWLF